MHLQKTYPESECSLRCGKLIWSGEIRPSPLSRTYKIRITCYGFHCRPEVALYGDYIEGIEKPDFPHHFEIDRKKPEVVLCLHMPYEYDYRTLSGYVIVKSDNWLTTTNNIEKHGNIIYISPKTFSFL